MKQIDRRPVLERLYRRRFNMYVIWERPRQRGRRTQQRNGVALNDRYVLNGFRAGRD